MSPGYVLDAANGVCYKALIAKANYWQAAKTCSNINAELVAFKNNEQVKGLMSLLASGRYTFDISKC